MTLDLQQLLLLGLLTATVHWIIARSSVMHWFWSRLKGPPARLLACPACTGFWLGLAFGAAGSRPVIYDTIRIAEIACAGLLATFLTPVFQAVMLWGLDRTALTIDEETANDDSTADADELPPSTQPTTPTG